MQQDEGTPLPVTVEDDDAFAKIFDALHTGKRDRDEIRAAMQERADTKRSKVLSGPRYCRAGNTARWCPKAHMAPPPSDTDSTNEGHTSDEEEADSDADAETMRATDMHPTQHQSGA